MSAVQLIQLERDVEVARARFAEDLGRLRDPSTFSALKHDLLEEARQAKDDVVAKAKEAAKEGAEDLLGQLKEKAAANPAAALAIGAGLAWRIIHKPPIASLLVGIGLVSLWRTEPRRSSWTPTAMADLLTGHGFTTSGDEDLLTVAERLPIPVRQRRSLHNGHVATASIPAAAG